MWKTEGDRLVKGFDFQNFAEALNFVNKVGEIAESKNHHPNILMHDYKHVNITLTTHDKGNTISEKDIEMSLLIDAIYID